MLLIQPHFNAKGHNIGNFYTETTNKHPLYDDSETDAKLYNNAISQAVEAEIPEEDIKGLTLHY